MSGTASAVLAALGGASGSGVTAANGEDFGGIGATWTQTGTGVLVTGAAQGVLGGGDGANAIPGPFLGGWGSGAAGGGSKATGVSGNGGNGVFGSGGAGGAAGLASTGTAGGGGNGGDGVILILLIW